VTLPSRQWKTQIAARLSVHKQKTGRRDGEIPEFAMRCDCLRQLQNIPWGSDVVAKSPARTTAHDEVLSPTGVFRIKQMTLI